MTKPCHPSGLLDAVKGQWVNNTPHIILHILVRRVVNEECVFHRGSTALHTIRMVKESVQGFYKKIRSLTDRITVGVANYIAPVLVKGATSQELLPQIWSAHTLKGLDHGFQVLLIGARLEGHLKTLEVELQELSDDFPKCVQPVPTICRWPLL